MVSSSSDIATQILGSLGKNLAADILSTLRDMAGQWWASLDPDAVSRIEHQIVAVATLWMESVFEQDPDAKRMILDGMNAAANSIRADIEAAGIVVQRGALNTVEKMGMHLLLGAAGL